MCNCVHLAPIASPQRITDKKASLFCVYPLQVSSYIYGSWSRARTKKGCSVPLLGQVWISNGCQLVRSASWDHSRTTGAPAKKPFCLLKEAGLCAYPGWCRHYLSLYLHTFFFFFPKADCYFYQE